MAVCALPWSTGLRGRLDACLSLSLVHGELLQKNELARERNIFLCRETEHNSVHLLKICVSLLTMDVFVCV